MRFLIQVPDEPVESGPIAAFLAAPAPFTYLLRDDDGRATRVASFRDEDLALRVADLLNRHGLVDAPLPELGEIDP